LRGVHVMALGRWDFMLLNEGIDHAVGQLDLVEVLRAFCLGFAHLRHEANLARHPELSNPRSFWSDLKVTHYRCTRLSGGSRRSYSAM